MSMAFVQSRFLLFVLFYGYKCLHFKASEHSRFFRRHTSMCNTTDELNIAINQNEY